MHLVIPAIDIRGGKCVRLVRGDFLNEKIYGADPIEVARVWESQGATYLHIVDLDGARLGSIVNMKVIKKILKCINIPIQVGGGVRSWNDARDLLTMGVSRVILGSTVLSNISLVQTLVSSYGDRIVVALDSRDGFVMVNGWKTRSRLKTIACAKYMQSLGVSRVIFTDTMRDGTLTGINSNEIGALVQALQIPVIAGGGISSLTDIQQLESCGVKGVIVGKALYEKVFTLKEALYVS